MSSLLAQCEPNPIVSHLVRFAAINEDLDTLEGTEDENSITIDQAVLSNDSNRPISVPPYELNGSTTTIVSALSPLGYGASLHSSPLVNTASPTLSIPTSLAYWPFTTAHEARLFHHYIQHLSPWIDVCDRNRHFGTEVPKRASSSPVIAHGIFAVASRSLSLLSDTEDIESHKHMSACLQIMIAALDDPLAHWDENLVASVILMRIHEEVGSMPMLSLDFYLVTDPLVQSKKTGGITSLAAPSS